MPSKTPAPQPAAAVLPDGIEIFRAGRHIDDSGVAHNFSEADVAGMATSYDPALREAPLVIGHPKDNLPAYGWVKAVTHTAEGSLSISTHQVEPQFAEMVTAGRFKKRSASFYPPGAPNNPTPGKWYLRHVAFLGAQQPAIAGLKSIQFSEDDATGAINFSEPVATTDPVITTQEPEDMPADLQTQLNEANAKLAAEQQARAKAEQDLATQKTAAETATAQAASFAETARANRKAGFVSFAEAQVTAGRLQPKDKDMAVATLESLADAAPVSFSEGDTTRKVSPSQWLQDLISNAKPSVSFGEFAPGNSSAHQAQQGQAKGKTDAEIDQAARAYMREHKVANYAEALTAVTTSFTS